MTGIQWHWIVCLKRPDPGGGAKTEVRYASDPIPETQPLATNHDGAFRFDTKSAAEACATLYRERGIATEVDVFEVAGTWNSAAS